MIDCTKTYSVSSINSRNAGLVCLHTLDETAGLFRGDGVQWALVLATAVLDGKDDIKIRAGRRLKVPQPVEALTQYVVRAVDLLQGHN